MGDVGVWILVIALVIFGVIPLVIILIKSLFDDGGKTNNVQTTEVIKVRCPFCQSLCDVETKKCSNCNANIN
ncbi:MAG: hypothetical protein FWD30_00735 [Dehalococcoidia bacterium]|nr:hypothetical protein [Dehalococcoidia bacterium]